MKIYKGLPDIICDYCDQFTKTFSTAFTLSVITAVINP